MRFKNGRCHGAVISAALGLFLLAAALPVLATGTWSTLVNAPPGGVSLMLLLTDGTVMCQQSGNTGWYKLTPDIHGSYVNGTWTTLASMTYSRRYYSSQVLQDGRVFVAGGEYGTGGPYAEMYDPIANTWTVLPDAPDVENFIDSISETLPNGNVLIAPVSPSVYGGTVIWNVAANAWQTGPALYRGDDQDEASWVKLADQSILTIDPFGTNSERYIPAQNQWINDANVPTVMYGYGGELGAGFLLPNGNAFYIGATNHTAIYTPSGTTSPGVWTAGATIPNNLGAVDAPAAMMANGNILCALGTDLGFGSATSFYEYNYANNTFTAAPAPSGASSTSPYGTTMLDLPDGTVLLSGIGPGLYDYNPGGTPLTGGMPVILSVATNLDGSLLVSGTQLTGISEGAAYGDDNQMASDYPIGRITNSAGNTLYCRTYNWSVYNPMTGTNVVTTDMTLPPGLLAGTYPLVITANGISSAPFSITTVGTPLPVVANLTFTTVASNQMVIRWNDINLTETGYVVERSTDGVNYSVVATLSGSTTTYTDSNVTPLGQYYYTVFGTNAFGPGLVATPVFAASMPVNAVPAPWSAQDIGPVLGSGASGTNATGFTVIGSGNSLGTSNDQFQCVLQPLAGDATLTARVTASEADSTNALAGVMMRNSSGDAVGAVVMGYDAGNQTTVFEYRAANNGDITATFSAPAVNLPVWVQLVRSGNNFTGYSSPDGNAWTQLGTVQTILPTVLESGLVSSAGVSNLLNTSTFDNVTVSGMSTTNPVPMAEWKLDETAGSTAVDSRGGFDGTYYDVTLGLPGATPATGYSAGFDGVSSQIAIPPLNLNSNVMTITAWILRTNSVSANAGIFFNRANSTISGLDFYNSAGEVGYTWNNTSASYSWQSGLVVPLNVWTFVALVITPTNGMMYMATNGTLSSATNKVANAVQAFDGGSYIGWDTTATNRYFSGQLDEVQLFNQALTAAQLKQFINTPGINLTAPANGTTTAAFAPVNLSATATNTGGHTINLVQYFSNNGQLLGAATASPFTTMATNLAIGNYAIFARLFYDAGYFVDSPLNAVNVFSQPANTNIWDATGSATGAADGSGNWGGNAVNWWNGSAPVAWTDASPAVFGAGASGNYTVTLTNPVTPYSITFNSGSTYTLAGTNPILLDVPGTPLAVTANANAIISAPLTGDNSLLKLGNSILTLTASNSYAGATIVGAGTLRLTTNAAFGYAASVTNTGALDLDGQDFTASMFGTPVNLQGVGPGTSGGALTNSSTATRGQLQDVALSGNATIGGANTIFIGGTNAANGILDLNGFTLTKNGSGTLILNGLTLSGAGNLTVAAGTLQLMDSYTGGNQQNTTLSGSGNITVSSGASLMTQVWGASLGVTMPVVLNGGTFGSAWPGPNGTTFACPVLVNSNSTLNFNGQGYGDCTLSGNITGAGGLTVTGDSDTRTFTGTNSYGWTLISAGALQIGNGTASGSLGTGNVTNNAALIFNRTNNISVTNQIAGSGTLTQAGSGVLILSGTNTYTGATTVSAGTLQIGAGGTSGSLGKGAVTNNASLTFNRTDSIAITNLISGTGKFVQSGTGTVSLFSTNTYGGSTTVNAGTLLVNGLIGTNITTVNAGATLGGNGKIRGAVTVAPRGTFSPGNNGIGTLTVSNNLVLAGNALMAISKTGSVTTNDIAFVTGLLTEGGTLTVTNTGTTALASGDTFKLFNAVTYSGTSFTNFILPTLSAGLYWNTNLVTAAGVLSVTNFTFTLNYLTGTNGSLSGVTNQTVNYGASGSPVTATANTGYYFANWSDNSTANPRIDNNVITNLSVTANFAVLASPALSGNLLFSGSQLQFTFSGNNGQTYKILTAGDLTIPLTNWSIVSTGIFGNTPLTFTNNIAPGDTNGFFRISSP